MKKELAAGIIIKDRKVLLLSNKKHGKVRLEPPGGKVHKGEGIEESVVREAKEELGIKVGYLRFLGSYGTDSPEGDFMVHMYLCDIVSGEPKVLEEDKFSGFGWYGYEDLLRLKCKGTLVPNMAEALPDLKKYM